MMEMDWLLAARASHAHDSAARLAAEATTAATPVCKKVSKHTSAEQ
jgi:hypothetical protein